MQNCMCITCYTTLYYVVYYIKCIKQQQCSVYNLYVLLVCIAYMCHFVFKYWSLGVFWLFYI